jgi:hypothetical protein
MKVESKVKDWVNNQKLWAYYQVDVVFKKTDMHIPKGSPTIWNNYVNCHFKCKAHLWDTTDPANLVKGPGIAVDVYSKYNLAGGSTGQIDRTAKEVTKARTDNIKKDQVTEGDTDKVTKRAVDDSLTPALVHDKGGESKLNGAIWTGLKAAVNGGQSLNTVLDNFVAKVPGIDKKAKESLKLLYPSGKYALTGGDKSAITRLNNLYEGGQKVLIDNALKALLPTSSG